MDIRGFMADIARTFRDHYARLADRFNTSSRPAQKRLPVGEPSLTANKTPLPQDTLQLSPRAQTADPAKVSTPPESQTPAEHDTVAKNPDDTYFLRRAARLDYQLNLRFDLAALQRTVQSLAEGDSASVEQLVAAGFGLSTDMNIRGIQTVETNIPADESPQEVAHSRGLNLLHNRQAMQFAAADRDFALEGFRRSASKLMRSYNVLQHDGYQRAVNQFSWRYRSDTRFSFAHLERFNVQTARVANEAPQSLEHYVRSAGNLAESGTNSMLTTFFDAVEQYLDSAEKDLLHNAVGAFDQAVADLGFSAPLADSARAHITSSIESFFNRVDSSLDQIRSHFGIPETAVGSLPSGENTPIPDSFAANRAEVINDIS